MEKQWTQKLEPRLQRRMITVYKQARTSPGSQSLRKHRQPAIKTLVRIGDRVGSRELHTLYRWLKNKRIRSELLPGSNLLAVESNLSMIKKLAQKKIVKRIHEDREVFALLDIAVPSVGSPELWARGLTGAGVGIAIVDTGVFLHPDLLLPNNRVTVFKDFVNNREDAYDDNGHGTHCAGCAAGNGYASTGQYVGAAPKARIIAVKALNKQGSGNISDVVKAVQWCIDNKNKHGISIISLSLGSSVDGVGSDDPLAEIVNKAWDAGLVVCAAAGNNGPRSGTITSPGVATKVITVGAIDDKRTVTQIDDSVADFSSRGPVGEMIKPDVVAPGKDIVACLAPYSYLAKNRKDLVVDEHYLSLSGTSMATPIVAGLAAQLLEAMPQRTPNELKDSLMATAFELEAEENAQGRGAVRVTSALEYLR